MRLGADPEVFLTDNTGKFISSIGLIGGSKDKPFQIEYLPKGYTLQEDNVTLEFGIPPASNSDMFVKHIQTVLKAGLLHAKNLQFSHLSCTVFPKDQLTHPAAHIFGCEPDFNAWTNEKNCPPNISNISLRSCGGHIHVETNNNIRDSVRASDLFLSVPAVFMDYGIERKQLYGKAGAFRSKPYGFEYRSLSNFWIFHPRLIKWVWESMEKALEFTQNLDASWYDEYGQLIQNCINNNNKKIASQLIKKFNLSIITI